MNEPTSKLDMIFGHMELKQIDKFENGRLVSYGYSIKYDRNGKEVSRTEPFFLISIGYDDGTPFTEADYNELTT